MEQFSVNSYMTLIPNELNTNINHLIRRKMRDQWVNKCFKEYGYVMDLTDIKHISPTYISRTNQDLIVNVQANIIVIKPKQGQEFSGRVHAIYPEGIFIILMETFYALIPLSSLIDNGYAFNNNSVFINESNGTRIEPNSYVSVIITDVHFDNNTFNCICTLVENTHTQTQCDTNEIDEQISEFK